MLLKENPCFWVWPCTWSWGGVIDGATALYRCRVDVGEKWTVRRGKSTMRDAMLIVKALGAIQIHFVETMRPFLLSVKAPTGSTLPHLLYSVIRSWSLERDSRQILLLVVGLFVQWRCLMRHLDFIFRSVLSVSPSRLSWDTSCTIESFASMYAYLNNRTPTELT